MKHKGTVDLRTSRLELRRFRPEDAPAMYRNWASDKRTTNTLSWQPHRSVAVTSGVIAEWVARYRHPTRYHWAIVFRGEPVGDISLHNVSDDKGHCEIGYCLGSAFWNQGLATEAVEAVLDFAFGQVGFHRVTALHDGANPASGRVMQKAGMVYEGAMREHLLHRDGTFGDLCIYGILAREWGAAQ